MANIKLEKVGFELFGKTAEELTEVEIGTIIRFSFDDESNYIGIFKGVNGNTISMKALNAEDRIAMPYDRLVEFQIGNIDD